MVTTEKVTKMHRNSRLIFVAKMTDWQPQEIHSFGSGILVRAPLVRCRPRWSLWEHVLSGWCKSRCNYLLLVFGSGNKSEWKLETRSSLQNLYWTFSSKTFQRLNDQANFVVNWSCNRTFIKRQY